MKMGVRSLGLDILGGGCDVKGRWLGDVRWGGVGSGIRGLWWEKGLCRGIWMWRSGCNFLDI